MDIASQMILFANVVDHGSFSSTARDLGLTPSAVSKQIGHLEDRLGVRLLNRSTRQISLTEEGRPFYERCAEIAAEVVEAEAMAHSMGERPQGNLRVATTVAFGKSQLLPQMPAFIAGFPELKVTLELTDRPIDLSESEFDMAIRVSEQIEDGSLIARKLTSNKRVICAAPSYIEAHGEPLIPEDLVHHNCLRISTVAHWNEWHFRRDDRDWYHHADGNFGANSADAIYHAALAGMGIAQLSAYLIEPDIRTGKLVPLLQDFSDSETDILAVYSNRRNLSPKVRVFIDYLVQKFQPMQE